MPELLSRTAPAWMRDVPENQGNAGLSGACPLVAVLGPTASAKSTLALHLATELGGEIVGCDSIQLYRRFDIGSAKPGPKERARIIHHLVDAVDPAEVFTAGDYVERARPLLREIARRGHIPIVAGGTGFYFRALIHGLSPSPRRDERLRERLAASEERRSGSLHRLLRRLDHAAAQRIHSNDVQKTVRALEITLLGRQPMSTVFSQPGEPLRGFRITSIGLDPDRKLLWTRIERRLTRMFEAGLLEEVRDLLAGGVSREAKPFEALGYKEALAVVRGEMQPEAALEAAQAATRQYAKRQMTWFRRETGVVWLRGFGDDPAIQHAALAAVREKCGAL